MTTPQPAPPVSPSPSPASLLETPPPDIPLGDEHLYDEDGYYYPEADGEPMPDPDYQDRNVRSARYQLDGFYYHRPGTYVSGNTLIYYERNNARRSVSPDCYVAFDVDYSLIYHRTSFWVWELGKAPDFVMEVASKTTATVDTGPKMSIYAGMGVIEYWLFDRSPDGEYYGFRLAGFRLVNGRYEPIPVAEDGPDRLRGYSPTLGLDIRWEYDAELEHGVIRFYNPLTEEYLLDYEESFGALEDARAERDVARAETRTSRAEIESARAETEAARAESEFARTETESARAERDAARAETEAARDKARAARAETEAARAAAESEIAALREQLRRQQESEPGREPGQE